MNKPITIAPRWSPRNFENHYQKHPAGAGRACWCELLARPVGVITREEYAERSLKVIDHCWIHFTAGHRESAQDGFKKTSYFVDDELCLTAVSDESKIIKTCFHDHPKQPPHILQSLESKTEFLKKWARKRSTAESLITNLTVKKVNVEYRIRSLLATYIKEFQIPLRTRAK